MASWVRCRIGMSVVMFTCLLAFLLWAYGAFGKPFRDSYRIMILMLVIQLWRYLWGDLKQTVVDWRRDLGDTKQEYDVHVRDRIWPALTFFGFQTVALVVLTYETIQDCIAIYEIKDQCFLLRPNCGDLLLEKGARLSFNNSTGLITAEQTNNFLSFNNRIVRLGPLLSPVFVVLTLCVVGYSVFGHVYELAFRPSWQKENRLLDNEGMTDDATYKSMALEGQFRRRTMYILILPLVYSICSMKGMIHMWVVACSRYEEVEATAWQDFLDNHSADSWAELIQSQFLLVEASFYVGDLFEAQSLYLFGEQVLAFIVDHYKTVVKGQGLVSKAKTFRRGETSLFNSVTSPESDSQVQHFNAIEEQDEENEEADTMQRNGFGLAGNQHSSREIEKHMVTHSQSTETNEAVKRHFAVSEQLMGAVNSLAVFGIRWFVISCSVNCIYSLSYTEVNYYLPRAKMPDTVGGYVGGFLSGLGFVASFVAIGNILILEQVFGHDLHSIHAGKKFWSTKVLVSLAYIQSTALGIASHYTGWTLLQQKMLYSTTLCIECFFIAVFHLSAWPANESWYVTRPLEDEVEERG